MKQQQPLPPPPKMGDFYDPEHPTPEEEENEGKIENVQKMGFIKGPMFKGVASSRFLPKGTKTKVNLEEQGRQKVSFSFSLTKKTLQNRFLTALGNDKQNDTPNPPAVPLQADFVPKIKMDPGDTSTITEESSPPKPKVELGKIHFKKHLLHVTSKPLLAAVTPVAASPPLSIMPSPVITESVVAESPPESPPPPPPALQVRTPSPPAPISVTTALPQIPTSVPVGTSLQSPLIDVSVRASKESLNIVVPESLELDTKQDTCSSELLDIVSQNVSEKVDISPQKEDSHIGKEEETPDSSKSSLCSKKTSSKKKFSQSEGMFLGSESDEDSVQTSSSQRSHDFKNSASVEKERESKKSLATLKGEDLGKSSRSKTERDDKHFSYSKPDRDSRYMSSRSRSERDRRRSRSRSRSDRGSRTSSCYSRSERSHYYESERRYHRSSPYRERPRYSRSYTDNRMRESSDSEEEYKKIYSRSSDSRRTSSHSSFYRDSRTSTYSKSDRDSKIESFHVDAEKRGKYSSKPERESKRTSENELMKRCCSPPNEMMGFRRSASYSKHESNASRNKSVPWKSTQKSDKMKSSLCCVESTEDIKHQSHSLTLQTTCSKSNELRMVKIPERDKTLSPSSTNRLHDSPTFKRLGESPIFKSEFMGNDSHDSIKELDTLSKGKHDQLRTYCPVELDVNGSPGEGSDLVAFCASKTEDIFTSSDDSINRSEVSPLIKNSKSCILSSNGFQSMNRSKEKDLDDSSVQHNELNSSLKEMDPSVPSQQDKLGSFPGVTVDYSKTVKESADLRVSYCKTKDLDSCNTLDDNSPCLYQLETESTEPTVMKVIPNSFINQDSELQSVICDNKSYKNLHSLQPIAQESEQNVRVKSASVNPCDSNSPVESSSVASVCGLMLGIKVDNPAVVQHTEGNSPLGLDTVLQNQSTELPKHTGVEIIELDEQQINPGTGKRIIPWKNRHNSGLPTESLQTEEVQEEANVTPPSGRERTSSTEEPFNKQEGSRNMFISGVSESLFSSCNMSGIIEEGDSIAHAPKCDSSGNASEFVSPLRGDYSDSSQSTSDESDTEDTDSDDSSIPRNRLQSVVVVPKNSTLPMEEISPCSSQSSQVNRHYSDNWEDDRPESSKSYEERFEGMMSKNCPQTEKFSLPKGADKSPEVRYVEPSRKQMEDLELEAARPQSDGVDSTSQADVVSDTIGLKNLGERIASKESLIITKPILRQQEELPAYSSDGFEGVLTKSRQQNNFPNRPDSRLGKTDSDNFSSSGDFSRVDGFHSAEDLGNLGWDFSQPEKPSTTYQQPDSSYGIYTGYNYQQSAEQYRSTHNYWQGNGYWDPRLANRPPGIMYDRVQGHVPDSLTNDHEEEDEENWDDPRRSHFSNQSSKFLAHLHREKGSVQAHEISSNSIKDLSIVNEKKVPPKNLEKGDVKDRGPPKKRRQELESDSESDSDMQDRKKVRVEVEQLETMPSGSALVGPLCVMDDFRDPQRWKECARQGKMPCYFDLIEENVYLTERKKNKSHRDIKRMQCECTPVSKDDRAQGEIACGEDCLNRLLMIECSSRCPNGDYCSNRRFQRKQHADVEVILTEKKGWGLRAAKDLPSNTFVLEYCGEVLDHKEFKARVKEYARNKNIHYYFMALKNDEIIDATQKGNCSRFMNHSCEPNCETQKWTVNGQLRVGFFTTKLVPSGSELTFDYQFQRYGAGAWKNSMEEWTTEDWNEDLSETKVFTASSVPAENHVTPGQSIDLVALLQKPSTSTQVPEVNSFEPPQQQGFGQALVFTNSQHNTQMASGTSNSSTVNSYSPQSLSSVLGSGFGELGSSKMANPAGSQILDQLKSPSLGQFSTQSSQQNSTSPPTTTSTWDLKPPVPQSSIMNQFDFKSQPEPSPVLSQLSQRQQHQTQPIPVPPPGMENFSSQVKLRENSRDNATAVNKILQLPSMSAENQAVSAQQTQPKQIKPPKRRVPPSSKIPASAVEMPGSADVTGLNVQFGALEFGSEPSLPEFGSALSNENSNQAQISLYPKPVSDPLNTSLPISNTVQESTYTTSIITSSSLTNSSQSTSPVTTSSSYDQNSVHSRIAYQSSMAPSETTSIAVTNGHGGVRTQQTLETTSSVTAPKTTETSPSLPTLGSLPSTVSGPTLLPSATPHTATLPSLSQSSDLSSGSLTQLSSSLSSHQNNLSSASSALSSSTSHTHAGAESAASLQPSTAFSATSASATSTSSSVVSMANSMNTTNSLGLSVTSVSVPSATARAAPLVSSGKAPPNLPQGVPPLLHNQYIVGPGGLLPAYPIYGYDDLQMLQSRLPMDYYGITFPAPATLTGRDGSLANNPYSGDVTKFGRGDSASPAPTTTLAQPQQNQSQTHHSAQQPFLNPTLPPGYSYTGLPYYAGVPSAFQYGPTMFVPPASAKQHGVNLNTATAPFQQASGYGQHSYGAGYDDLTQGTAAGDYSKGAYSGSSPAQNKSAGSGPGKGVSVTSSNTGVPDIAGSVYNKTQTFDKQGFHAGTPPPFSLPSALGSTGPLTPGAAPGYAPAPFLHILPAHQQPHSQMLHHHLQQDGQGGSGQRSQPSTLQPKSQATKPTYGSSPYWTN